MRYKIALISNDANSFFNFRKDLIKEFLSRNFKILALAPGFDAGTRKLLLELGTKPLKYRLSRAGINPFWELISILSLLRIFKKEKPDIVFCFQIKTAIYGSIAAALCGIEKIYVMIEGLGYVFTDKGLTSRLLRKIIIFLLKRALVKVKKVFLLNPDDREEFIRHGIIKPDKITVLYGIGVNLDEWTFIEPDDSQISFIYVGRFLKEKGILEYLRAAEIIRARYPEVKFIILGNIDSNPGSIKNKELNKFVEKEIVQWPGFVDVKPWLAKASVFVLPSYREGVPRSAQEALAMGRPIITTDAPGCRETVIDSVNGFLVPVRDVKALVKAMEIFIKEPGLIKKMALESRKIAEIKFNVLEKNKLIVDEILN